MKDELKKIIIAGTIWLLAGTLLVLSLLGSGEGIGEKSPKYNVDPDLEKYLVSFVDLAALKGIDLNYIYDYDITIKYTDNQTKNYVATSFGRNKDKIIILVKRDKFAARTEEGRKYVMYHELGHDVLNFEHLENPKRGMMEPTAYTGFFKNYERFSQERQSNYLYKSLNKMFNRYLGKADDATDWAYTEDGISDFDWVIQKITKFEVDGVVWVTTIWYAFDEDYNIIAVKTVTQHELYKKEY